MQVSKFWYPAKTNMEPENTPVENEKHLPKPPILGFKMSVDSGVYFSERHQSQPSSIELAKL